MESESGDGRRCKRKKKKAGAYCNVGWTITCVASVASGSVGLVYLGIQRFDLCPWEPLLPIYAIGKVLFISTYTIYDRNN
jgi:hypothetical protein